MTRSKKFHIYVTAFFLMALRSTTASATDLILKPVGESIIVAVGTDKITAKDQSKLKTYIVSRALAGHLTKSSEATLINSYPELRHPLFLILAREPSRPNAMGQGYCGVGEEDFLLLVKLEGRIITLQDEYLLQSCLKSKALRTEQIGLNVEDVLHLNSDGSYSFEMIDEDVGKISKIKISNGKFRLQKVLREH